MTDWPNALPSGVCIVRAIVSDGPPAGYGTIRLTDVGEACASTLPANSKPQVRAASFRKDFTLVSGCRYGDAALCIRSTVGALLICVQ